MQDPTLTGPLTADGTAVDTSRPRFRGETTTTGPLPYGASPAEVEQALLDLDILPMARPGTR